MQDIANQQRNLDREIADERRQDDMLLAYLAGMSQLLTDKDRPLHRAQLGDSLSTVARASAPTTTFTENLLAASASPRRIGRAKRPFLGLQTSQFP
jgi:hypothetical protein